MHNEIDSIIEEYKKECDLSKSYFYVTYKTRLMKYDGNVIPAKDRGRKTHRAGDADRRR